MSAEILLTRVTVDNFRGLKHVVVDLDRDTVLIGENNSGKTSFLNAVRLALEPTRAKKTLDPLDFHMEDTKADPVSASAISITLEFVEPEDDEWSVDEVNTLTDIITVMDDDRRRICLRVQGQYDPASQDYTLVSKFLDASDQPMTGKAAQPGAFGALRQLRPFFYLSALRDASREFGRNSPFWGPFLRTGTLSPQEREEVETALAELNDKVVASHAPFKEVGSRLASIQDVVPLGSGNIVSIDALPSKVFELLGRTQINLAVPNGANIPLGRHGEGTQSLSVLLLFDTFVKARLINKLDRLATPIVAIEEPEAHLHPGAARASWKLIESLAGQKLVATHSGELLAEAPLTNIRRFSKTGAETVVRRIDPATLEDGELRKFNHHIRRTRGELLFARCWLLVEGECDLVILEAAARVINLDLHRFGVRIVEYRHCGVTTYLKAADQLGISWHCMVDGDQEGANCLKAVKKQLGKRKETDHATQLSGTLEHVLCTGGFAGIYYDRLSKQVQAKIDAKKGTPEFIQQLCTLLPDKLKTAAAAEVALAIQSKGESAVPAQLRGALSSAFNAAGGLPK